MEFNFLKGKLEAFLELVTEPFKIADPIKKSPKGLSCTIERDGKVQKKEPKPKKEKTKETKDIETSAKKIEKAPEEDNKKKDENK
jgi:hypothetical protein